MSQVSVELGRASTATTSLGETAVRTLAGVSSGAIAMSNLYGKSNAATYNPPGGTSGAPWGIEDYGGPSVSTTITASRSVTWTWTRTSGTGNVSITSGSSASSITFSITGNNSFNILTGNWNVSATDGVTTKYWTVYIENSGLN
jgi:hypothetical protein